MHSDHSCALAKLPKHILDTGHTQAVVRGIQSYKQRLIRLCISFLQVPAQIKPCAVCQICFAFFASFSIHNQLLFPHFDICHIQRRKFRDTHSGGVQKLYQGTVPKLLAAFPKCFQLLSSKWLLNGLFQLQCPYLFNRIASDQFLRI